MLLRMDGDRCSRPLVAGTGLLDPACLEVGLLMELELDRRPSGGDETGIGAGFTREEKSSRNSTPLEADLVVARSPSSMNAKT